MIVIDIRYAEIVNVKLGNGQTRKGQVLEIAGRKAVVQVSLDRYPLVRLLAVSCGKNYYYRGRVKCARSFLHS